MYLTGRKDKNAFIDCYIKLVDECESFDTYMILGDAYMKVHDPIHAIEAYKRALSFKPKDESLALRIGDTLISIHEFRKAVLHFESYIDENEESLEVRMRLSSLQAKLDNGDGAIGILKTILDDFQDHKQSEKYLPTLLQIVEILGDIREQNGFKRECLQEAKDVLTRDILNQDSHDRKKICASITTKLAELFDADADFSNAETLYKEAIELIPDREGTLLAYSKHLVRRGKLDDGKMVCEQVNLSYPNNIEAMLIMCDIHICQSNFNEALAILEKTAENFQVLMRYIVLSYQVGRQSQMETRLHIEEQKEREKGTKSVDLHACLVRSIRR